MRGDSCYLKIVTTPPEDATPNKPFRFFDAMKRNLNLTYHAFPLPRNTNSYKKMVLNRSVGSSSTFTLAIYCHRISPYFRISLPLSQSTTST